MIARLKNRLHRRDGQSMILFAIMLPLLLVFVGFVVDGAHAFVDYRHLQNTADASALAAAQTVSGVTNIDCPTVGACATSYVSNNGFTTPSGGLLPCTSSPTPYPPPDSSFDESTTCYQWPYVDSGGVSHPDEVLVKLRNCTSTFFGGIVGVPSICESVRSVARTTPLTQTTSTPSTTTVINGTTIIIPGSASTSTSYYTNTLGTSTSYSTSTSTITIPTGSGVAFAMSTACPAISYTGQSGNTLGSVETNGGLEMNGAGPSITWAAWGMRGTAGCDPTQGTVGQKYGPFGPIGWPVTPPNPAPPTGCTSTGTATPGATWAASNPPGVYCYAGALSLSASGKTTGGGHPNLFVGYTWFASCISVSSSSQTFSPATGQSTLFDAYGTDLGCLGPTLSLQGSSNSVSGNMFAPNGSATISGGGASGGTGFFEAQTLSFSGNFSSFNGNGGFGGTVTSTTSTAVGTTTIVSTSTSTTTTTSPGTTIITPDSTVITPGSTQTSTTGTNYGLGE